MQLAAAKWECKTQLKFNENIFWTMFLKDHLPLLQVFVINLHN